MHTITKRIITFTAAVTFCLSQGVEFTNAAEELHPSSSRDSARPSERHLHHPGKDEKLRAGGHFIIKETSKLLDMECSALKESLKSGKTLPELALEKKGWTEDQYVQKLAESAGRNLDQAVAEGRLTQAEANKLKERLPTFLKIKINNMGNLQR